MSLRIEGDQLEQYRIRLERDIAHTIPSPPSMSPSSVHNDDDDSSIDLPRHNSNPRHSFHSFEHPSHFDSDFFSRHGDGDSVALDPDLGHTMSTAAHHASALTLTAGLHGRNYTPGKSHQSNQEFDPQRPLQPMLGAADGLSMFNSTFQSKTKSNKSSKLDQHTFDPIIVDATTELDRFLKTGFRQPNVSRSGATYHYLNRSYSQPEPRTELENASASPKSPLSLSQALGSQFSPKRPRSTPATAQSFQFPKRSESSASSTIAKSGSSAKSQQKQEEKARAKEKENKPQTSASFGAQGTRLQSKIHFQEPIDTEKTPKPRKTGFVPDAVSSVQRPILVDKSNKNNEASATNERSKIQVHLPDVTNLTAAVESPMRGGEGHLAAKGSGLSTKVQVNTDFSLPVANRRFAADVVAALDKLQFRLEVLERDNGVSRRRVKDLECDLEECKAEMAYEWKKIKAQEFNKRIARDSDREQGLPEEDLRYRNAVEENKILETFVATMREHVTRLTSELALHRSLIDGLRQDVNASEEIQAEVEMLNTKVERLSGEVERLKTFVEEGARERERFKDVTAVSISRQEKSDAAGMPSQIGMDITYVTNPLISRQERSQSGQEIMEEFLSQTQELTRPLREDQGEDQGNSLSESEKPFQEPEEDQEAENGPSYNEEEPTPPDNQPVETIEELDSRSQRYIEDSELARVQAEILERRSERNVLSRASSNGSGISDNENGNSIQEGHNSPIRKPSPTPNNSRFGALPSHNRPSERDELRNTTHRQTSDPLPFSKKSSTAAFPQIRGSRMERLFFAAPEHDPMTCHVCHRRKRRGFELNQQCSSEEDEQLLKAYFQMKGEGRKKGVPEEETSQPQTILTHVLRELEDDFSHYKAIYIELAEQYAVIDAVSNVAKRNVLADHLREVIDSLEQKGDQIAALYQLLRFQDKPLGPAKSRHTAFV